MLHITNTFQEDKKTTYNQLLPSTVVSKFQLNQTTKTPHSPRLHTVEKSGHLTIVHIDPTVLQNFPIIC